jgi:hypothetical protein
MYRKHKISLLYLFLGQTSKIKSGINFGPLSPLTRLNLFTILEPMVTVAFGPSHMRSKGMKTCMATWRKPCLNGWQITKTGTSPMLYIWKKISRKWRCCWRKRDLLIVNTGSIPLIAVSWPQIPIQDPSTSTLLTVPCYIFLSQTTPSLPPFLLSFISNPPTLH